MNQHQPTPEREPELPLPAAADLPAAEAHERSPSDSPRLYIASLTDYNHGVLHGTWIDADPDPEIMQDGIDHMLAKSPTAKLLPYRSKGRLDAKGTICEKSYYVLPQSRLSAAKHQGTRVIQPR